jgi:hypothetical protein
MMPESGSGITMCETKKKGPGNLDFLMDVVHAND